MPSQKVLKNNKISIFCDSLVLSQKVKPVTKSIKILKFSVFCDGVMPSQKRKKHVAIKLLKILKFLHNNIKILI